jgi:hypothetical protein
MTFESLFTVYRVPIILLMLGLPWVTYLLCYLIPGWKEEPFVLSANLWISVFSLLIFAGYLAYVMNTGGWQQLAKQTDVFLLFLAPYHLITSLWLSRLRMPLQQIPAFRTMQGIAMMALVFLVFSWLASRIYIVFFSFMPFSSFLGILAILLAIAYLGYRKVFD